MHHQPTSGSDLPHAQVDEWAQCPQTHAKARSEEGWLAEPQTGWDSEGGVWFYNGMSSSYRCIYFVVDLSLFDRRVYVRIISLSSNAQSRRIQGKCNGLMLAGKETKCDRSTKFV